MSVDKKKEREDLPDIDAGWEEESDSDAGDRPTLTPPFDLERYAKTTAAPTSEVVVSREPKPPSDSAVTMPPPGAMPPSEVPLSQRKTPRSMPKLEVARKARRSDPPPSRDNLLAIANRNAPSDRPSGRVSDEGSALDLVAKKAEAESGPPPAADPVIEMRERFALGDYSRALVMAESLLEDNPT